MLLRDYNDGLHIEYLRITSFEISMIPDEANLNIAKSSANSRTNPNQDNDICISATIGSERPRNTVRYTYSEKARSSTSQTGQTLRLVLDQVHVMNSFSPLAIVAAMAW